MDAENIQPYFFLAVLLVIGFISLVLIRPFFFYLIGAAVLVYIAYPGYKRVHAVIQNETVAAFVMLSILILVAVIPSILVADMIVQEARNVFMGLSGNALAMIDTAAIESRILELTGQSVDIESMLQATVTAGSGFFSDRLPGLITTVLDAVIGVFVMGITMYYLFRDGDDLVQYVTGIVPLRDDQKTRLLQEINEMMEATLVGHLLSAAGQGILAGFGLWLAGIPNVVFWTFIMIVLGLIPLVGSFVVWGPAALYLIFIVDRVVPGFLLLIYGATVIGLTDNVLRAHVAGKRGRIHPLLVMLGVIGGIPLFGLLGVVLGPLTLGLFAALLRVFREEFAA